MGAVHSVCAVATQGRRLFTAWTTSYKVHLSTDGITWNTYKENNVEKVTKIIYFCLGVEIYKEIIKLSKQDNCAVLKPYMPYNFCLEKVSSVPIYSAEKKSYREPETV